ncbi:MAG: hypothetical protein DMF79_09140 [Acidobacteria bacterium]|nr:MAG: hypothetical protein DMF79_09140 [Acidobacteriota bacterium]
MSPLRLAFALALLAGRVAAQAGLATLEVAVLDDDGPIVGGKVRLQAPGLALLATTDARGQAVFFALPPGAYRADLLPRPDAGRACGVEVSVETASALAIVLRCGSGSAETPPVSRDRAAEPSSVFSAENLGTFPRPTDPWSVLRDVPGVVVDRVNVGGSETAQQSLLVSHGDGGGGALWTLDGFDVTDPAALGSTTVFPDMDALQGLEARTTGLDVRTRTPGVQVGLRLRAPSGRFSGAAHVRYAGAPLQSDNLPAALAARVFPRNETDRLLELGGEAGGPLKEGRLWLWGAVARNALRQDAFTGHPDSLRTTTLSGKGRLRLGTGALSLLLLRGDKVDEDRDPTTSAAPEARWRQSGPTTLLGLEDTRTLGRLSLVSRLAYMDAGFRLDPQGGTQPSAFEDVRGVAQRSFFSFRTHRPRLSAGMEAASRRSFLGGAHDLVLGLGYRRSPVETDESWPGNGTEGLERGGVFFRAFRLTGFAVAYRDLAARSVSDQLEAYAQDTARWGRWTVTMGLRLDRLAGRNRASAVAANPEFPELLPGAAYAGDPARFDWLDLLPRAGVTWRVNRRETLLLRAHYAAYAAPLGAGEVTFDNPLGRDFGSVVYYWLDRNANHTVERGELDGVRGSLGTTGIDPDDPGSATSPNRIDSHLESPRTHELAGAFEWSGRRWLQLGVQASYRRQVRALWRPLIGLSGSDYVVRGGVSGQLFGTPYNVGYFAPASTSRIVPGNGRILTNREGYAQDALNLDVTLRGRVGSRVDWQAWGSGMDWRELFTDRALAIQDPTSTDSEPLRGNGVIAVRPGGLGRGDLFVNARWMAGALVRGRLPWAFEAAAHLHARDGFPIPYFQVGDSGDPTGPAKNVLIAPTLDSYRLPSLWLLDARLSRAFPLGRGTLTADLDAFNLLNRSSALQVARDIELAAFNRTREIVRPRIVRIGLRYRF